MELQWSSEGRMMWSYREGREFVEYYAGLVRKNNYLVSKE